MAADSGRVGSSEAPLITARRATKMSPLIRHCQTAANTAEEFLRCFPGVLAGKVLVQNEERDGRINFLQNLAGRFSVYGLQASGNHHQFRPRCLERILASSMVAVVRALYPALHNTSRKNVRTSVDS